MLHEIFPLLPTRLTAAPPDVLAWSALAGLLLGWLGARFSRSMLTLAAVAAGAWVGVRLPAALHWSIDPMCLGVAGAIVLGTAAYLLHRTLVAVALGAVLALWALALTWVWGGGGVEWNPSGLHWSGDAVLYLNQLWRTLPGDLGKLIPCFCGGALALGLLTGAVLPRLSRCLLYGIAGPTLALATALPLATRLRPDWLALVPESAAAQAGALAAWVVLNLLVQWRISPDPVKRNPNPPKSQNPKTPSTVRLIAKSAAPRLPLSPAAAIAPA